MNKQVTFAILDKKLHNNDIHVVNKIIDKVYELEHRDRMKTVLQQLKRVYKSRSMLKEMKHRYYCCCCGSPFYNEQYYASENIDFDIIISNKCKFVEPCMNYKCRVEDCGRAYCWACSYVGCPIATQGHPYNHGDCCWNVMPRN